MEMLILLVAPTIVSWLLEQQKKVYSVKFSPNKKLLLRSLAAVLSFVGVFLASLADGEPLSVMYLQEVVSGVLVFAASQIPYSLGKKKGKSV